jgi:hypothetical protein
MANLEFHRGDRLTAEKMQELARRIERLEGVKGSGRIQTRRGGSGPLEIAYVEGVNRSLGKASTAITAMAGTTFGTGTVDFYYNVSGTATVTGQSESVLNTDTAISSGKWVWVEQDMAGDWFVSPMQCE